MGDRNCNLWRWRSNHIPRQSNCCGFTFPSDSFGEFAPVIKMKKNSQLL